MSTLLHATVYMFSHNLLNVLVQIANKMGLQKKNSEKYKLWIIMQIYLASYQFMHLESKHPPQHPTLKRV
jgi:hypothetical protein